MDEFSMWHALIRLRRNWTCLNLDAGTFKFFRARLIIRSVGPSLGFHDDARLSIGANDLVVGPSVNAVVAHNWLFGEHRLTRSRLSFRLRTPGALNVRLVVWMAARSRPLAGRCTGRIWQVRICIMYQRPECRDSVHMLGLDGHVVDAMDTRERLDRRDGDGHVVDAMDTRERLDRRDGDRSGDTAQLFADIQVFGGNPISASFAEESVRAGGANDFGLAIAAVQRELQHGRIEVVDRHEDDAAWPGLNWRARLVGRDDALQVFR